MCGEVVRSKDEGVKGERDGVEVAVGRSGGSEDSGGDAATRG